MTRELEDPLVAIDWSHHDDGEGWTSTQHSKATMDEDLLLLGDTHHTTTTDAIPLVDTTEIESAPPGTSPTATGLRDKHALLGSAAAAAAPSTSNGAAAPLISSSLTSTSAVSDAPSSAQTSESLVSPSAVIHCVHCAKEIGKLLSTTCDAGLLHNECVAAYRLKTTERCAHCQNILRTNRRLIGSSKVHPECVNDFKDGKAYVPPRITGMLKKFSVGRSLIGRKNWQDRFVVVSKALGGIAYFETEADALAYEQGNRVKPPKGVAPLNTATSRLITIPTFKQHPKASSASKELIVIFHEGEAKNLRERKLLLQFSDWDQRCAWLAVLVTYIHTVDDLNDYEDK
jgi:hypothetical protein